MHDVIIIGGSYAGIAAATQLGRARKDVLVIDAGVRRNRNAAHAHGFFGHDGMPPGEIAARGRAEALAYPTVRWREGEASAAHGIADAFVVTVDGEHLEARRLVLATGVADELPPVPGLAERWGRTAFACPYCHGYELGVGRLGVLASSPFALHSAALVTEWAAPGEVTLFLNGAFEPDDAQLADLAERTVNVERRAVTRLTGAAAHVAVVLAGGEQIELEGLFVLPRVRPNGPFAGQLGCALDEGPFGPILATDPMKETSVPGVFACGDVASLQPAIALAVADGVRAGAAVHQSLVFRKRTPSVALSASSA
ncbi:MAG: Thioredoxin reductase [Labilithrix sp.]|nr:Thioredoxin reductase [Labilithrix sp.]